MFSELKKFLKKEAVLSISFILAVVSCFFVVPDAQYAGYVDTHTLMLLFALMVVMAGMKELGVFQRIGEGLLKKIHSERGIAFVLIFLCFISSMLITNDVALITFVPLALLVLNMANMQSSVCLVITFMTIAANLGSMLTPIGNPQNLYLYAASGMTLGEFVKVMLPYTVSAAVLLTICSCIFFRGKKTDFTIYGQVGALEKKSLMFYLFLFAICLLNVAKILPITAVFVIIVAAVFIQNKKLFLKVDYSLLATFVCFFVFIGNMGRISVFRELLVQVIKGNERIVAVISSQVISNVPAALLLSGFTSEWKELLIGTNLGGLGTLIASMASLISYKQIAQEYPEKKGKYFGIFTVWNVVFLAVLLIVSNIFFK